MSNGVVGGSYSSSSHSYPAFEVAGEEGSYLWNYRTSGLAATQGDPATSRHFMWSVDFRSKTGTAQPGLKLELLSNCQNFFGAQTKLRIIDMGTGFDLLVDEKTAACRENRATDTGYVNSTTTTIATGLSYTAVHSLETRITFVAGNVDLDNANYNLLCSDGKVIGPNDVVQVYLNGTLIHTGSTDEVYWWGYVGYNMPARVKQAVNVLTIQAPTVSAAYKYANNGLYFSKVAVTNQPAPIVPVA
jgi:hypothetical protein